MKQLACGDGILDDVVAPYWFDKHSPLQAVIHALKYQQIPHVGYDLGKELGREFLKRGVQAACAIPVPLHPAKLREREYNQAELIARGLSEVLQIRLMSGCIARVVNTRTQTELTAVERRRNVDGAFVLSSGTVNVDMEAPVVIVDDVFTTGATIRSIASVLRRKGHTTIIGATVALASRNGLE